MLDFSVVICAYTDKRWDELAAAVSSVQTQKVPPKEVIVVVDHNPSLFDRVQARYPEVVVVTNHEHPGLGGARNSGISIAQGDVIAFLDDDAVATPDWLENLSAGYEDPRVVGVGGSILPAWEGSRPGWFPQEFDWVVGCTYKGMPEKAAPVRNLIGCNMSYRLAVFSEVGSFRLGYGCDETEFCIRLLRHAPDKILLYQPRARVYHQVPAARGTWRHFSTRCYFEGGSKAVVSWLQGRQAGLSSERTYTLKVLPYGVWEGIKQTLGGKDGWGVLRAGAIIAGLALTAAGYLTGTLRVNQAARRRGWAGKLQRENNRVEGRLWDH